MTSISLKSRETAMLNSITLRQLWLIIEQTQTHTLLELSALELSRKIEAQLSQQSGLSSAELMAVESYIQSRMPLIRDSAESRATLI